MKKFDLESLTNKMGQHHYDLVGSAMINMRDMINMRLINGNTPITRFNCNTAIYKHRQCDFIVQIRWKLDDFAGNTRDDYELIFYVGYDATEDTREDTRDLTANKLPKFTTSHFTNAFTLHVKADDYSMEEAMDIIEYVEDWFIGGFKISNNKFEGKDVFLRYMSPGSTMTRVKPIQNSINKLFWKRLGINTSDYFANATGINQ